MNPEWYENEGPSSRPVDVLVEHVIPGVIPMSSEKLGKFGSSIFRIGKRIHDPPPTVFELVVEDYLPFIDPKVFGIKAESINPFDYFVTSGDAVEKAKVLERDYWKLAGRIRQAKVSKAYETAMWKAAGQARKMLNALKEAKGENTFLETEWVDHCLILMTKNPR